MNKILGVGALVITSFLGTGIARAYDDGGDYGNGNDQRRCHNGENCRGSFSPGPFDRSPVDAFNNNCFPGATCYYGTTTTTAARPGPSSPKHQSAH